MSRSSMSLLTATVLTTFCAMATSQTARADWSDNFDGGLQQASWQFGSVDGSGNPSPTFTAGSVNDQLVLADTNAAAIGGAGAAFGAVLDLLTDVRMTGIINPNGDDESSGTLALLARGNILTGQFYAAEINYSSSDLIIFRNDSLALPAVNLATTTIPGMTTADSIFLDFRLLGDSLSARAYDAPGGTLLGSVSATDSTYSGGLSGVLVSVNDVSSPMLGVWDDITAMTIPEPTTSLLAITAFSAALFTRLRRRVR